MFDILYNIATIIVTSQLSFDFSLFYVDSKFASIFTIHTLALIYSPVSAGQMTQVVYYLRTKMMILI